MTRDSLARASGAAAAMPGLLLAAQEVAHSFMKGTHGRRRAGPGEAFWQFRPWQAGDSARDVDWRQTAKRDAAFIRQQEWEAAQAAWLWRDASRSMELHGKKDFAEILLLALGIVLLEGGEQVSLLGSPLAPQSGTATAARLYEALTAQDDLTERARPVSARGQAVLIGDFYAPSAALAAFCGQLAARGVKGLLVQVTAPQERDLALRGHILFKDPETGSAFTAPRAEELRAEYNARFAAHTAALEDMTRRIGWRFAAVGTETPPAVALASLYDALAVAR